jgi:CheY-like chemotaxis protein
MRKTVSWQLKLLQKAAQTLLSVAFLMVWTHEPAERSRSNDSNAIELPSLMLLDLSMPRKDKREALSEIKAEPATMIPIC